MKNHSSVFFVFLVLSIAVFLVSTPTFSLAQNLIELHKDSKKLKSSECIACHGDRAKDVSLDPKIEPVHTIHVGKLKRECTSCHQSIDLREDSAANIRRQVDFKTCNACHNGKIAKEIYRR